MLERKNKSVINEVPFPGLISYAGGKYFDAKIPVNDPDLVVKEALTKWRDELSPGQYKLNDFEQIKRDLVQIEKNFSEFMPKSQVILGKNEKDETVAYIIQERIEGKNMEELPYSGVVEKQLKTFLKKSVDVYIKNLNFENNSTEPQSILPDIITKNFIFGTNKRDSVKNPRLYFIDTYPLLRMSITRFLTYYLPLVVKGSPPQWRVVCEEFKQDAENRINQCLAEHQKVL